MEVREFIENNLDEEMNDKQKKKVLKKVKISQFKPLSKDLWMDREAVIAAGLDYPAMKSRYNEYMKVYNDLVKYTSPDWVESSKHEMALQKATELSKKLKSMAPEIKKFEAKIKKGTAKAAASKTKKVVSKNKTEKREKREKFISSVKTKLANPGQDLFKSFKKSRG